LSKRTVRSFELPQLSVLQLSAITLLWVISPFLVAQNSSAESSTVDRTADAMLALPDAPGESAADSSSSSRSAQEASGAAAATGGQPHSHSRLGELLGSHGEMVVSAGQTTSPLLANQKVTLGMKAPFSLFSVTGWVFSAGWAQLRNGAPNYGTDKGAYGERLGATAIRNVSEAIFGTAVLAPILHEDPRYYVMGSGHNFARRSLYAATRVLITRDDSGRTTPNFSLIGGNLAGSALTNAYYPSTNRGFSQTAMTFGNSLGGSAIGFVISEFRDDAFRIVHLKTD
jgi:hypothetical protein